jgi:hypothetical protein
MIKLARDHYQISAPFCKILNISIQESKSSFSYVTGTSKNVPDLKTSPICLNFPHFPSCNFLLYHCQIPLTCQGTRLGEFRPRSQGGFLEFDANSLSDRQHIHQSFLSRLKETA